MDVLQIEILGDSPPPTLVVHDTITKYRGSSPDDDQGPTRRFHLRPCLGDSEARVSQDSEHSVGGIT